MGMVADSIALLGCSVTEYQAALAYGDDFEVAWNECKSGSFLAWLLRRIGFDWKRVAGIVFEAMGDDRLRMEAKKFVGCFETPEAAHNLAVFLKRLMDGESPRCSAGDQAVADAYRGEFAFDEVREKLLKELESVL